MVGISASSRKMKRLASDEKLPRHDSRYGRQPRRFRQQRAKRRRLSYRPGGSAHIITAPAMPSGEMPPAQCQLSILSRYPRLAAAGHISVEMRKVLASRPPPLRNAEAARAFDEYSLCAVPRRITIIDIGHAKPLRFRRAPAAVMLPTAELGRAFLLHGQVIVVTSMPMQARRFTRRVTYGQKLHYR